jgi:hypothetical protein
MKLSIYTILFFFSLSAFAQQSYIKQHSAKGNSKLTNSDKIDEPTDQKGFIGCVDYKVAYQGVETTDEESLQKIDFLIADTTENYGVERTRCFNELGDWISIYKNAKHVDKVLYFAESNEEYTLFQNGVMKFMVNSDAEPEGFEELGIKEIIFSEDTKSILGYKLKQIVVQIESGTKTEYWVTEEIARLPASYENYKFAYINEIMSSVKGVHLYQKKTVADLFVTIEEAVFIDFEKPNPKLFMLPNVDVYHW